MRKIYRVEYYIRPGVVNCLDPRPVFRILIRIRIRLDPHSIWAWIQDPDPYSESGSRFQIQMSKNRFKKPKFTMTDFKDKNRKMLRLS